MNKRKSLFLIIFLIVGLFGYFLITKDNSQWNPSNIPTVKEKVNIESIFYEVKNDEKNAFELLKTVADIEYQKYDFGVFVESINGTKNNDKHFWSLYINDEQSQTGADQTILQKGDRVEWRYEEIKY